MKTAGIIFLVLAGIAFIAMIGTFASGADVEPGRMFNTVIVNGVLGGVLLHLVVPITGLILMHKTLLIVKQFKEQRQFLLMRLSRNLTTLPELC